MADIESMSEDAEEDDDDTYLHNKTLDAESQEVEGNNLVLNALSILRAPRKSELARKRKLKVNQQKQRTRNVRAKASTAPNVSALARIREFSDEHFKGTATDKGAIFLRSTILNHIEAKKTSGRKREIRSKETT